MLSAGDIILAVTTTEEGVRMRADVKRLGEQMRQDWDARATLDPWHYVLFRPSGRWREDGEAELDQLQHSLEFEIRPSDRVLEIGCGVGRLTWTLARRAQEVWALDISSQMLEIAKENLPEVTNVHFLLGDGTSLGDIPSGSKDLVFSSLTLTHLPHRSLVLGYLAEAARVLAPGGRLAVQVNNESKFRFLSRMAVHQTLSVLMIRRGRRRLERGRTWSGSRIDLAAVREGLEAGGMRLLRVSGAGSLACWIHAVRDQG